MIMYFKKMTYIDINCASMAVSGRDTAMTDNGLKLKVEVANINMM